MVKYANFANINNEIQALLDEIAELRRENLELIQESTNLEDAINPNDNVLFDGTGRLTTEEVNTDTRIS